MARTSSEAVPVIEREATAGATGASAATAATSKVRKAAATARQLSGPYGASFDGTDGRGHETKGLTFERRWTTPGSSPSTRSASRPGSRTSP